MRIEDLLSEARANPVLDTKEKVEEWAKKRGKRIEGEFTVGDDLQISVEGSVDFSKMSFTKLPAKFKKVTGRFLISNTPLETLEGCPDEVGEMFNCGYTHISSFEGGPKQIGMSKKEYSNAYYADHCKNLTSLKGIAENAEYLNIGFCDKLKKFDYMSKEIRLIIACATGIETLEGLSKIAPKLEALQINSSPIESGILSLMKIPTFRIQSFTYRTGNEDSPLALAGDILDNIDKSGGDILDAQSDLIDAGLEKMATF